jgi:hypothetical protein
MGYTASGVYTLYPGGLGAPSITAYCDLVTDGGGWTLTWAYAHAAGQTLPLVQGVAPTSPSEGYSHVFLSDLYGSVPGASASDVSEVCPLWA